MTKTTIIVLLIFAFAHTSAHAQDRLSRGEIILRVTSGAITVAPNGSCSVEDPAIAALVPEEGTLRWIPEFRPGAGNGFVFTPNEPDDRSALVSQLSSLSCVLLAEPNAFLRSDAITENPNDFYFQTDYWPHSPFTNSPTGLWGVRDPQDLDWLHCSLTYGGSEVGTYVAGRHLPDQWHLAMTQTNLAWLVEQGDPAVKVAIIDSGVDWRHPDLAPNIWQNPGEDLDHDGTIFRAVPADSLSSWIEDTTDINGVDDDENWGTDQWAATDDIVGLRYHSAVWDSLPTLPMWDPNTAQCGSPRDTYYNHHYGKQGSAHGTQMSSIICAAHNGFGCVGVCPELSLIPISAGWSMEAGDGSLEENLQHMIGVDELSTVLDYCMAMDVHIINMSLSYLEAQHGESLELRNTLEDVAAQGIIVCNSAGNDNNADIHIPSKYESVLCCAVVAPDTVKAHQSSFATYVDFCAPSGQKAFPGEVEPLEYRGDEFMAAVVWGLPDPYWPWVHMPHKAEQGGYAWADSIHTYKQMDGDTSGGAAQLSGAFALLKAHYPNHSRDELIAEMVRGAIDVDPYQTNPAWVGKLGDGMINPYRSLTEWGGPRASELQSGAVWSDSVWVSGDYVVLEDASLTIQPGTIVCVANFDNEKTGDYLDLVEICGAVNAVGTFEAPIRFVAYGPASYGTQELVFGKLGASDPGAVRLEYCEFIGFSNILVFGSTLAEADTTTVANCDFLDPGTGQARFLVLSDAQLRSCTFAPGWTVIPATDALIDWCKFEHVAGEGTVYPPILLGADGGWRVHLRNSILRDTEVAIRTFADVSDTLYLENVLIEHVNDPPTLGRGELGIHVQGGVVKATGLTVRGYTVGVSLQGSGRFTAEYSSFTDCYQAALNNPSDNLMFFGYCVEDPGSPLNMGGYNVFVDNEKNNIVNLHYYGTIQARKCWWGSPSGPPAKSNRGRVDALFPLLVDPNMPPPPDFIVLAEEPSPPFSVGRNYPNPFNPVTEFTITVPRGGGLVRATVYDIRGRAVRLLLDKPLASGEHRIEFNGKNDGGEALPSGMYLCRFNFRDREEVVKATLVK